MGLWGDRAAEVIREVLRALPMGTPPAEVRKAVSDAYPFEYRTGYAYRVWLRGVRRALGPDPIRVQPREGRDVTLTPWGGVVCRWRRGCRGCFMCDPWRRKFAALSPEDIATWRALADDPGAAPILADWLAEHDLTPEG